MELYNFVFLFACALTFGHVHGDCGLGWTQFSDTCHHFGHTPENWHDALSFCRILNGSLAEVETMAEAVYLDAYVTKQGGAWFWIGLNDLLEEGQWRWISGASMSLHHWYDGEPNTAVGTENCGIIGATGRWYDAPCRENRALFICEKSLTPDVVVG